MKKFISFALMALFATYVWGDETFSFTFSSSVKPQNGLTCVKNEITYGGLKCTKASSNRAIIGKGQTITFTAETGYALKTITLTWRSGASYQPELGNLSATNATLTSITSISCNANADTVTLSNSANNENSQLTAVTIVFTAAAVTPTLTGAWKINSDTVTGANIVQNGSAPSVPTFSVGATSGDAPASSAYNVAYNLKAGSTEGIFTFDTNDGISAISTITAGTATIVATLSSTNEANFKTPTTNTFEYTITVAEAAAPVFTTPASEPEMVEYMTGDVIAALEVAVTGTPTPTLQWYSNSNKSTAGATALKGENGDSFTPSNAEISDLYYYCVATNTEGSAQSEYFHVIVLYNSLIIKVALSGSAGATKTMSGTIGGTAAVNYLSSSAPYKIAGEQSYVSLTLSSGYFQAGDSVVLDLSKAGQIFHGATESDAEHLLGVTTTDDSGIQYYILPASFPASINTIHVGRTSADYNGTLTYMAVYRLPDSGGATSLDNTTEDVKAIKHIENGQLIIEKNGFRYNAMGQIIR